MIESEHDKVAVGTRLYGLFPVSRFVVQNVSRVIPPNARANQPSLVEFSLTGVPFMLQRFREYEVLPAEADPLEEDWKITMKEIYTMAFYMDENLLTDTGMINSVIISCASSKTALALAYCLRMRDMRYVVGLTSKEHEGFAKSTNLYHDVFAYEDVQKMPNDRTIVYIDIKCDGALRQAITLRMGTLLMYNMVVGPAVFQKSVKEQVFEKRAREILFDEATWRQRRRQVAEVTKTGRNEILRDSYPAFVERAKTWIHLRHLHGIEAVRIAYDELYENTLSPSEAYVWSLHDDDAVTDEIFG